MQLARVGSYCSDVGSYSCMVSLRVGSYCSDVAPTVENLQGT